MACDNTIVSVRAGNITLSGRGPLHRRAQSVEALRLMHVSLGALCDATLLVQGTSRRFR